MSFKFLPNELKPRERFLAYGSNYLSDVELLAVLLRTGTKKLSVIQLSEFILNRYNGLQGLLSCEYPDLITITGIGNVKAIELLAIIEFSKRLHESQLKTYQYIKNPEKIFQLYHKKFEKIKQEHFVVICLNTKNAIIDEKTIFIGSLAQSLIHPREVFQFILLCSAASFLCLHNHPSGEPTPSKNDIEVTQQLCSIANMIGIPLLDHIIIGHTYFSFRDNGYL